MIKSGATHAQRFRLPIDASLIDRAVITYSKMTGEANTDKIILQKFYPDTNTQTIDGYVVIMLSQQETEQLYENSTNGYVLAEVQMNLITGAVAKTEVKWIRVDSTLATEYVEGSTADVTMPDMVYDFQTETVVYLRGERGEQGPKGDKGDTGKQGPQGIKGDKGDPGRTGIPPQIIVTVPSGAEVTCTNGIITLNAVSDGKAVFELNNYGTWRVTSSMGGQVDTDTVIVDTVKQYSVEQKFASPILDKNSWDQISEIAALGKASNYWAVGDRKAVSLSGTVGRLSMSGTYYCYIIGIDHNRSIEGANRIHFQFGYSALNGGVHLAFIDSGYNSQKTFGDWFNMNNANSNANGWNGSLMRTVICPAFKNAMPSDLQAVLKTVTKYSDNTGGGSNIASYVTATTDEIFLPAEYEVFGVTSGANSAEQNYQAQYAWYSAGNSKVRYRHSAADSTANWWLRSVAVGNSYGFCRVDVSGSATTSYGNACYSIGFAPAFCV